MNVRNLASWRPGQSGNPSGRPKGGTKLAKLIRQETSDGQEMVDFAVSIMRGEVKTVVYVKGVALEIGRPLELRVDAMKWLADRGFGKVPDALAEDDVEAAEREREEAKVKALVDSMSREELIAIARGATIPPALPSGGPEVLNGVVCVR
jgi:hypothetical protein